MFFFFTIYLQFLGFSPLAAGLVNVPMVLILLSTRFGRFADRRGPRSLLTLGPFLIGCSLLLLLPVEERAHFWTFGIASMALLSLGLAMVVAPITATALASAPARYSGIASGVNQTISRLGNLLSVAIAGLIVLLVFGAASGADAVPLARGQDDPALRDASVDGFRAAVGFAAALAFAAALVGALGLSDTEAKRR